MNENFSVFDSKEYDEKIIKTIPYYNEIYKQIVDCVKCSIHTPIYWLDVGCGTGKMAEYALNELSVKKFVFCDCSHEMINIAKNRFVLPNTEFIVSKSQDLNILNQFDIVTAIFIHRYSSRKERTVAVRKCYNALKENGFFITYENFAPNNKFMEKLYLNRWEQYQIKNGKNSAECKEHIARYNLKYFPITIKEHIKLLKNCGFRYVEILSLSYIQVGFLCIK